MIDSILPREISLLDEKKRKMMCAKAEASRGQDQFSNGRSGGEDEQNPSEADRINTVVYGLKYGL